MWLHFLLAMEAVIVIQNLRLTVASLHKGCDLLASVLSVMISIFISTHS